MRINSFYAYFRFMKARLNITIEEDVLTKAKVYAEKKGSSVSQLVEDYLRAVTEKSKKKSVIDLIESLPKPDIDPDLDLKKAYYEENRKKYGF